MKKTGPMFEVLNNYKYKKIITSGICIEIRDFQLNNSPSSIKGGLKLDDFS